MRSGLEAMALSYDISGSGLASANTIGFSAMDCTISVVTTSLTERPRNTSAPCIASARVVIARSVANSAFCELMSVREVVMTPLLSHITMFSLRTPRAM